MSVLVTGEVASNVSVEGNGGLVSQNEADDVEAAPVEVVGVGKEGDNKSDKTLAIPTTVGSQQTNSEQGRGKRQKFGNKWYDVKAFMRH